MNAGIIYDEDYFEHGIETGKSCFTNYRWIPELTIPMVMSYIDHLGLERYHTILDFGCAKGFVVKAFRLLYRQAWGCDVSEYAIGCSDEDTKRFLRICGDVLVPFDMDFDYILAKDVLEHIDEKELPNILSGLSKRGKYLFAVTPLGENNKFTVPAYELDITHKTAKNPRWWEKTFRESGWEMTEFSYQVSGIKDNWSKYKFGNGFFLCESVSQIKTQIKNSDFFRDSCGRGK